MKYQLALTLALTLTLTLAHLRPSVALADTATTAENSSVKTQDELLRSYRRLLPLEGSSNFRDLGGYPTRDGRTVKRGLLFRSGAMTSLTEDDMAYLAQFDFQTVVDLRSSEELELYPNRWVDAADIDYVYHDYSIVSLMKQALEKQSRKKQDFSSSYVRMTDMLKPQLKLYFETLLNQRVPAVVNCSAGQDRTGVTSALLLSVLGVDRTLIFEDYLLSTDFRRPLNEKGDVDLEAAAETNAFAGMMLRYSAGMKNPSRPNPLVTANGTPFVQLTFDALEAKHGSIPAYLDEELGVSPEQQAQLRAMYLD
ncbi:MAG: tyrosine-protein phosphatase [Pseudomonadota bacterium]